MSDLTSIVEAKIAENCNRKQELISLISSGEAIAFVGAGLSSPIGYPPWNILLEKLCSEANNFGSFSLPSGVDTDALEYADAIKKHFRKAPNGLEQYESILGREYEPKRTGKNHTSTHQTLVKLPFRAFITTNYEDCIEYALQESFIAKGIIRSNCGLTIKSNSSDRHLVSRFLRSISEPTDPANVFVAHLHGHWDDTKNIILTASDYLLAYEGRCEPKRDDNGPIAYTLHKLLAWSLFATRRMVFIGFSMDDPFIKKLLEIVTRDLWEIGQPIHYVILPLDDTSIPSLETTAASYSKYGLQPIYYDNLDKSYAGLDQILKEAYEIIPSINRQTMAAISVASSQIAAPEQTSKAAKPTPEETTNNLSWLTKHNEQTAKRFRHHED